MAVQEGAQTRERSLWLPRAALTAPDGAARLFVPTAPQERDPGRINYCVFCCCCTFRTTVSASFVKLGQHDVFTVNVGNVVFHLGPHPHRPSASSQCGHPSSRLSVHTTDNALSAGSSLFTCLFTTFKNDVGLCVFSELN